MRYDTASFRWPRRRGHQAPTSSCRSVAADSRGFHHMTMCKTSFIAISIGCGGTSYLWTSVISDFHADDISTSDLPRPSACQGRPSTVVFNQAVRLEGPIPVPWLNRSRGLVPRPVPVACCTGHHMLLVDKPVYQLQTPYTQPRAFRGNHSLFWAPWHLRRQMNIVSYKMIVWLQKVRVSGSFNSVVPGRCGSNFECMLWKSLYTTLARALTVKLLEGECQRTSLMISQHWFR